MARAYAPPMHGTPTHRRFELMGQPVDTVPARTFLEVDADPIARDLRDAAADPRVPPGAARDGH